MPVHVDVTRLWGEWGNVQRTPLVWLKLAQDKKVISWLSNSRHGAAVNVGKGCVSANCSVLCGQKYTKLMDDYHAVFQLGSTFVSVELPPYLHLRIYLHYFGSNFEILV